jgi:CMP-N-acetylneuraminic acid synthetase|tara:strand:+ start:1977 stop:2648 length:672 start_codon:yes stop_codon:yes gene_type:complete
MKFDDFLFLVPARKGSKGIKGKNLVKINKKELIIRTFESLKSIKKSNKYVLTDNYRIKNIAKKFDIDASYIRKKIFSGDNVKLIDTLRDFCNFINTKKNYKYIVVLQPTSPFRTFTDIKNSLKKFKEGKYSSLFSVSPSLEHPNESIYIKNDKVQYFIDQKKSMRQFYKKSFFINGAVYVSEKKNIFKNKLINKKNHGVYIMKKINSLDLDDMQDLDLVKKIS